MGNPSLIIVIGASAGGVDAIRKLTAALPDTLDAAVFVVLHIGAHKSELPVLLNHSGKMQASHPHDGESFHRGRIYVAPPDHHMVIERGVIRLTRGPRENWARPAVDPLFRSAARAYGAKVIGVILTGGLNDGTAGLYEVRQRGGTTIVQDPSDASDPGMPRSALQHVAVDHCLPLGEIPPLLATLAARSRSDAVVSSCVPEVDKVEREAMTAEYKLDEPVAVTCPDCGGALLKTQLGTLTQFRCHIGHVYTAEVMMAAQFAAMEWALEAAMRALSERGELCRQMAEKSQQAEDPGRAREWAVAMLEAKDKTGVIRKLLETAWTHPGEIDSLASSAQ